MDPGPRGRYRIRHEHFCAARCETHNLRSKMGAGGLGVGPQPHAKRARMKMSRFATILGVFLCVALLGGVVWYAVADSPTAQRPRLRLAPAAALESSAQPVSNPAPQAPVEPVKSPAQLRVVEGVVRDTAKSRLIGVTTLVQIGGRTWRTQTDAKGRYRFDDLPRKAGRVKWWGTGYETLQKSLKPDATRLDATLDDKPGLRVVVTALGEPVEDAVVSLIRRGWRVPVGRSETDAGGRGWLAWPDEGAQSVMVRHPAHGMAQATVSGPGEVALDLPGGGWITGRVTDQDGNPVAGVSITASSRMIGRLPLQSFDSNDGSFKFGPVAPGKLTLHGAAEGYQPAKRKVVVESGETVEGADLKLKASFSLTGRVTDARSGDPIEGAQVIPAEWRAGGLAESVGGYTDDDGRYTLNALPGGRTSVRVKADGYRSVLIGGVEGRPGDTIERDFSLTAQRKDQVPASELTGIGAVLGRHPDGVRIGRLMDGGPAAEVLEQGDVVVAIDGESVKGKPIGIAAQAIRGEEGTDIELMVRRGGKGEPVPVVITRSRVTLPSRHHRRRPHN